MKNEYFDIKELEPMDLLPYWAYSENELVLIRTNTINRIDFENYPMGADKDGIRYK